MYTLSECPSCGASERTLVAEHNRLTAIPEMQDSDLARYDYMLCHGCGLVYASRRPDRPEYDFLYANFNEFLVRTVKLARNIFNVPDPLTDQLRAEIDAHFAPWWQLRDCPQEGNRVVRPMIADLEKCLGDLPLILPAAPLKGAKILQIRAKTGQFADFLKRVFGAAQVDVITLFPIHEYTAGKNPGVRARSCLDYENFSIPFDEKYDLILANHMLTHTLSLPRLFEVLKSHLADNGTVLFRNELDDSILFKKGKNVFSELRPFHFQQFDVPALTRVFNRFGFEIVATQHNKSALSGIARLVEQRQPSAISADELSARRSMYVRWRDESLSGARKIRLDDHIAMAEA